MKKKYIDANVFLNPILYDDAKAKKYEKILYKIINKEFIAVTSVLTWDEIVYVVRKKLGINVSLKEGEKFLAFPNVVFIDATKAIVARAQRITEEYNLKPRDAIHTATALSQNCQEIISDDEDFDVIKDLKRI